MLDLYSTIVQHSRRRIARCTLPRKLLRDVRVDPPHGDGYHKATKSGTVVPMTREDQMSTPDVLGHFLLGSATNLRAQAQENRKAL